MNDDIFSVIEGIVDDRTSDGGSYTIKETIYDILRIATEQGNTLSTREIYQVLLKLDRSTSRGACNQIMTALIDTGRAKYVGKELRQSMNNVPVPVYQAVVEDE